MRLYNTFVVMIPDFDTNNNLPPGIYTVTWKEFCQRYDYTKHRKILLEGLEKGMNHLRNVGCKCIWIDGSFITKKHKPKDFDVCWDENEVNLPFLQTMYPILLDFNDERANQKYTYGGEFFPSKCTATFNPKRTYLTFFQLDREDNPKGIIKILL